jgi:ribosomal protein S18 acetylase RimI-like enzyme
MRKWLRGPYRAVFFLVKGVPAAYAVYRKSDEGYFIRQFYVDRPYRRMRIGKTAIRILLKDILKGQGFVSLRVLIHNKRGVAFWRSSGFKDRVLTLERRRPSR